MGSKLFKDHSHGGGGFFRAEVNPGQRKLVSEPGHLTFGKLPCAELDQGLRLG